MEYKSQFEKGIRRKVSPEYSRLQHKYKNRRQRYAEVWNYLTEEQKRAAKSEVKLMKKEMLKIPSKVQQDDTYRRLQYCRYADDWILGVIGTKSDAEAIKADIKSFLEDKLKLEMSEEKTKITHSAEFARFLSYDIAVCRDTNSLRNKNGYTGRYYNHNIKLYVPKEKWIGKLLEYKALKINKSDNGKEIWEPIHRNQMVNAKDVDIIGKVNAEIRGLYNYYSLANNVSVLNNFYYVMEYSMYKTLCCKYKCTIGKLKRKYSKNGEFGVDYQNKSGMNRCIFYNQGFKRKKSVTNDNVDILAQYRKYERPNSIVGRLKAGVCELCGETGVNIYMHHVRRLKDLKGENAWEMLMMENRRKTLALCRKCYEMVQG